MLRSIRLYIFSALRVILIGKEDVPIMSYLTRYSNVLRKNGHIVHVRIGVLFLTRNRLAENYFIVYFVSGKNKTDLAIGIVHSEKKTKKAVLRTFAEISVEGLLSQDVIKIGVCAEILNKSTIHLIW